MLKLVALFRIIGMYWKILPRSAYYNFRLLPIRQAIRLPIFLSNNCNVDIIQNGGGISLNSGIIQAGMIKIGLPQCDFYQSEPSSIHVGKGASLQFNGYATMGAGVKISVDSNAYIEFGNHFWSTGPCLMIARKGISFHKTCVLSWGITIMDHDAHNIIMDDRIANDKAEIVIGEHSWIGFNSTIMKGVTLPSNTVLAARTLVTRKSVPDEPNCLLAGSPAKIIKRNISWG